jgi:hypothetical protein
VRECNLRNPTERVSILFSDAAVGRGAVTSCTRLSYVVATPGCAYLVTLNPSGAEDCPILED